MTMMPTAKKVANRPLATATSAKTDATALRAAADPGFNAERRAGALPLGHPVHRLPSHRQRWRRAQFDHRNLRRRPRSGWWPRRLLSQPTRLSDRCRRGLHIP